MSVRAEVQAGHDGPTKENMNIAAQKTLFQGYEAHHHDMVTVGTNQDRKLQGTVQSSNQKISHTIKTAMFTCN